jgi:dihydroflavonol-4-reductase
MILITGANGLVGSFLCRELIHRGEKVRAFVRKNSDCSLLDDIKSQLDFAIGDINDVGSLADAMRDVTYIIHTAAIISFWKKKREEMFHVNVEGTSNVVNTALTCGIKKMLHVSSVAALGRKKAVISIDEENKWEESPLNTAYANTKYQAELEVYRGIEEGLHAVIVNPSVILGPGLKGTSSVRLFEYVQPANKYYTEGYLNYVDIRDLCDSIMYLLFQENNSEVRYIVNSGSIQYKHFFEAVAKELNVKAPGVLANQWMREVVWRLGAFSSFFTGNEPLITKETARNASAHFEYSSQKLIKETNIVFRPLSDTIQWSCSMLFK